MCSRYSFTLPLLPFSLHAVSTARRELCTRRICVRKTSREARANLMQQAVHTWRNTSDSMTLTFVRACSWSQRSGFGS
ncbi:hypothetical protein BDW75DRAFT_216130 [Aspergillus navahoensis]